MKLLFTKSYEFYFLNNINALINVLLYNFQKNLKLHCTEQYYLKLLLIHQHELIEMKIKTCINYCDGINIMLKISKKIK